MSENLACMIWADLGGVVSAAVVCILWVAAKRGGKRIPWSIIIAVVTASAFLGGCLGHRFSGEAVTGQSSAGSLCQNAPAHAVYPSGEAESHSSRSGWTELNWLMPTLTVSGIAFVTTGLTAAVSGEMDRSAALCAAAERQHP